MSEIDFNYSELVEQFPIDSTCPSSRTGLPENGQELENCQWQISRALKHTQDNYMTIGENLKKIRDEQLFKVVEKSFEAYVQKYLPISYRTSMRFIQISDFVSADVGRKKFNFSQLDEIASIPAEDKTLLEQITPNMSVKAIRSLKHSYYRDKELELKSKMLSTVKPSTIIHEPAKEPEHNCECKSDSINVDFELKPCHLVLKNKEQRLDFLEHYSTWQVLIHISYLNLTIFEYRLKNGISIIAFESKNPNDRVMDVRYCLFSKESNSSFNFHSLDFISLYFDSKNSIVDYLTEHKKEIE